RQEVIGAHVAAHLAILHEIVIDDAASGRVENLVATVKLGLIAVGLGFDRKVADLDIENHLLLGAKLIRSELGVAAEALHLLADRQVPYIERSESGKMLERLAQRPQSKLCSAARHRWPIRRD